MTVDLICAHVAPAIYADSKVLEGGGGRLWREYLNPTIFNCFSEKITKIACCDVIKLFGEESKLSPLDLETEF